MLDKQAVLLGKMAVQAAFVAIASRLVGAAFRVAETYHPEIRDNRLLSSPEVVLRREVLTTSMAWGFAFGANLLLNTIARRKNWNASLVSFFTIVTGALLAESIGRVLAYRKMGLGRPQTSLPPTLPQPVLPRSADGASTLRVRPLSPFQTFRMARP